MLRQRIYGLALGYEDLNDHNSLRKDLLWQTAAERSQELASCSTLCRLENRAGREEAWLMHEVLFKQFVNSFESAPRELILDFDCTDDRVHGLQEGRHFHGSYEADFVNAPMCFFRGNLGMEGEADENVIVSWGLVQSHDKSPPLRFTRSWKASGRDDYPSGEHDANGARMMRPTR
jgi:hypothetical protein